MSVTTDRLRLLAAFAAVYFVWGSTYLAIRIVIETIPPFIGAGARFLVAGVLLYAWERARGARRPTGHHWRTAAVGGALLLLGGNGMVFWAEQTVPSGLAALIVTTVPLWIAALSWSLGRERATVRGVLGLILGFGGVAILVGPGSLSGTGQLDTAGALVLVLASLSWAVGSLYSREAPHPPSQLLGTGMTMVMGGLLLLGLGGAIGEFGRFDPGAISVASGAALGYLVVFGSIVAFSAYLWLMKTTTPGLAATYAFVNPVVAVFLGWLVVGEELNLRSGIAASIIVGAVALSVSARARARRAAAPLPSEPSVTPRIDGRMGRRSGVPA